MRRLVVLFVSLIAVAMAASALAKTAAHGAQKAAVVRAAFGAKAPVKCYDAFISTVDRSWSSTYFAAVHKPSCTRWGSNGIVLLHRSGGRWRVIAEGSAYTCPIRGVPDRVERDLVPAPKCY